MAKIIRCIDHYGKEHDSPIEKFMFRASAYGALKKDDKVLFVQERWTKLWELPGGGVKPHEKLEEALLREFEEETGIIVEFKKLVTFQEDFFYAEDRDEAWHSLRLIYRVRERGGALKQTGNQDDITASQFFSRDQLNVYNTKPAVYSILDTIY